MVPGNADAIAESPVESDRSGSTRIAVLILGMHRSGTSALTRVISLLGADLPSNLMPGVEGDNETGFWESLDVYRLNDSILETVGSRWDDWRSVQAVWSGLPEKDVFKAKALEILNQDFGGSSFFVLKDPRICRLLPFWSEVLRDFGAEVKYVIPVRNPLEVAASLAKRDDFTPARTYLLWLRHVLEAEYFSRGFPRSVITYQGLLEDWRDLAAKLASKLGIHWARHSADTEARIDGFLERRHRHHSLSDTDVYDNPELPAWVKETYSALGELQADPQSARALARLDGIRNELDRAGEAFGSTLLAEEVARKELADVHNARIGQLLKNLDELHQEALSRDEQIRLLEKTLGALQTESASRHAQIESLQQALVKRDEQLAASAIRDQQIRVLNEQVAKGEAQMVALHAEGASRHAQIETLNQQVSALTEEGTKNSQQLQSLIQTLAERDQQLVAVTAESASRHAQIESFGQTLAERDKQLVAVTAESASRHAQIQSFSQTLAERDQQLVAVNAESASRHAQIESLNQTLIALNEASASRLEQVEVLSRMVAQRDQANVALTESLAEAHQQIAALLSSTSWRVTAPIRAVFSSLRRTSNRPDR